MANCEFLLKYTYGIFKYRDLEEIVVDYIKNNIVNSPNHAILTMIYNIYTSNNDLMRQFVFELIVRQLTIANNIIANGY